MLKEGTFIKGKYAKILVCGILGWVVSILGGMADSIIAGLFLNAEAVSAVGLISPLASIIYCITLLIAVGCPLMYSISLGAFEIERSRKIAGMAVIVAALLGIVMTILMIVCKKGILAFYGCTGNLYDYASEYYTPLIFLALSEPMVWTVYNLVTYDGDEKLILVVDILMAVSNTVFSLLLVQSKGIAGLAIGTVLSYLLGLVLCIPHFFKKSNSVHFKPYFSLKDLLHAIKLSSSSALTTFYVAVVDIVFNKFILMRFGETILPSYTVVNAVMNFATFLMCTMSAGAVFITVAYGEENNFSIRRTMKLVHRDMLVISLVFSALMIFIAPYWPSIYGITDPAATKAAIFAGRMIPATYLLAGITFNYLCYYSYVDKALEGNILGITYMLIGPIVLALPLGFISFNAMSIGFALTPLLAIVVLLVFCLIKKEFKSLPYLLPADTEINSHYDLKLTQENILQLRDKIGEYLAGQNVSKNIINQIQLVIEETLLYIQKRNEKTVCCECDILLNQDHVRLITKDNGVIFDMIQEADKSLDLGCYVAARIMEKTNEKTYTTTTSFNRNTYIWDLT